MKYNSEKYNSREDCQEENFSPYTCDECDFHLDCLDDYTLTTGDDS